MRKKNEKNINWDRLDVFTRLASGQTVKQVADAYGTTHQNVSRFCDENGIKKTWVLETPSKK